MAKHKRVGKGKVMQQPAKQFHGDVSKRPPSKALDPADHVATNLQGLPTEKYKGQGLGTEPSMATMPQTMRGPIDYPGQELGA
jgi:hypothetical protein